MSRKRNKVISFPFHQRLRDMKVKFPNIDVRSLLLTTFSTTVTTPIEVVTKDGVKQTKLECDDDTDDVSPLYFTNATKKRTKLWSTISFKFSTEGGTCWYCRHKFSSPRVGCPLRLAAGEVFEVEGIFCSLPCVKAFVLEQNGNCKYKESLTLLSLLSVKLGMGPCVSSSPSWKLLKEYGGHLSIDEYRRPSQVVYSQSVNMIFRGELFEERKA